MKKFNFVLLALMLVAIVGCSDSNEAKVKIGIVQISEHESLNIVREACIKQLEEKGYTEENADIIYKNASGDVSTLKTIIEEFKSKNVDVIIPISTPAAQAAAPYAKDIPIVFAAVSDPLGAKLVDDLTQPTQNITGTSNEIQVDQILDVGLESFPSIKTLGLLYNSGEVNSLSAIEKAKDYAKKHDIKIIESTLTGTADIQSATQYLIDNSDAIFIPNDNTVISAMDIVTPLTRDAKIPTFCGVDTFIKAGGLLNVGIDYDLLGKETANMVVDILTGTSIKDIPVKVFKTDLNVYINTTTAKELGFDISNVSSTRPIVYFE